MDSMEKFRQIGLPEPILKSIEEHKFTEPSEIQAKAIPHVLHGKDIAAGSATGSGKTLVFGAGIIEKSEKGKGIQALVLTPTRELAEQVSKSLKAFSKYKPLNIISVYGGVGMGQQTLDLMKADVVVGTPGRVLDHLSRGNMKTDRIKILILDEADRMLDMGFIRDVEKIIAQLPSKQHRQNMIFSATLDNDIVHLAKKYMNEPVQVEAEEFVDPSKLKQVYYDVPKTMKFSLLVHLLKQERKGLVMVFCNTRRNTDFVAKNLTLSGINALAIHGGLSQDKRTRTMEEFASKQLYILVCTDVAARGLDIKKVSHVYNYDVPPERNDYIHRIGRTARAGKEGEAITLLCEKDYENFDGVLRIVETEIEKKELPEIPMVHVRVQDRGSRAGFGRGRFGSGTRSFGSREGRSFGRSEHRSYGRSSSRFGGGRSRENRFGRRESDFGRRDSYGGRESSHRFERRSSSKFGSREGRSFGRSEHRSYGSGSGRSYGRRPRADSSHSDRRPFRSRSSSSSSSYPRRRY